MTLTQEDVIKLCIGKCLGTSCIITSQNEGRKDLATKVADELGNIIYGTPRKERTIKIYDLIKVLRGESQEGKR